MFVCDFPWFNRRPKGRAWEPCVTLWREAARLRVLGFDAAVILRFDFWWGAALAALAGIPRRVGYDVAECLPFLTEPVPYPPGRHEVVQNLKLCLRLMDGHTPTGGDPAPYQAAGEGEIKDEGPACGPEFISATDAIHARALLGDLCATKRP